MKKLRCFAFMLSIIYLSGCHASKSADITNLILDVSDGYSDFSSTWGLNISLDGSQIDADVYVIQWIVEKGNLKMWDEPSHSAVKIPDELEGYPCTYSDDKNSGNVIWSPDLPNEYSEIGLEIRFYSKTDTTKQIAHDSAKILKDGMSYSIKS